MFVMYVYAHVYVYSIVWCIYVLYTFVHYRYESAVCSNAFPKICNSLTKTQTQKHTHRNVSITAIPHKFVIPYKSVVSSHA